MIPIRATAAGGKRLLRLSNIVPFAQAAGSGALDIPVLTATGKILLLVVCGDVNATVESPYTITYDLGGSGNVFTQHKAVGGGEASGRPRLVIASVTGVPVTGVSKNIRLATFAASLSAWNVLTADLPTWWSGTVGNVDATAANGAVNAYTSPSISTGVRNSLLVGAGGAQDATLGALAIGGAGGAWNLLAAQTQSGTSAANYQALFASKIVQAAGTAVTMAVSTVSGSNSSNWAAGLVEIRP